jgi:Uma2 family endonuclease
VVSTHPTKIVVIIMVAVKNNLPRFTPEEYFAWEERQLEKHEYIGGEVYAMTGGTKNHSNFVGWALPTNHRY